jgi:hypothetical protein
MRRIAIQLFETPFGSNGVFLSSALPMGAPAVLASGGSDRGAREFE